MVQDFKKQLAIRISLTFGILLVLIGLIFYLASDIGNRSDSVFLKRSEVNSHSNEVRDLAKLRDSAKIAVPLMANLEKALPKRDSLFTLPRVFGDMASEEHLGFSFKFGDESKPSVQKPSQINFVMSLRGKYNDVQNFIAKIETSPYFITFESLDMIKSGDTYSVSLGGEVFFNG